MGWGRERVFWCCVSAINNGGEWTDPALWSLPLDCMSRCEGLGGKGGEIGLRARHRLIRTDTVVVWCFGQPPAIGPARSSRSCRGPQAAACIANQAHPAPRSCALSRCLISSFLNTRVSPNPHRSPWTCQPALQRRTTEFRWEADEEAGQTGQGAQQRRVRLTRAVSSSSLSIHSVRSRANPIDPSTTLPIHYRSV